MKHKIVYSVIFIISITIAFLFGKFHSKNNIELENNLKIATDKLTEMEKRNEELIRLTDKQELIINNLDVENKNSTKHIELIKEINSSTKKKLNELESSSDSAMTSLNKLKENNKILKEYFNSIVSVTEE